MSTMKLHLLVALLLLLTSTSSTSATPTPTPAAAPAAARILLLHQQAPFPLSDLPVTAASSTDRIFASAQTSNGVAVVDPSGAKLEGVIQLGGKLPETLGALYRGQNVVHGAGFSPDRKTVAAICPGSDSVVFIDAQSYEIKSVVETTGRAPHEATFSPSGEEVWVAVRGSNFVEVLDASNGYKLKSTVGVPDGPGMVAFNPEGDLAFVCSSFSPEAVVVDTSTKEIVARVPQNSTFCPNLAVTPDGEQLWLTLKDSGRTQIVEARKPFRTIAVLETGAITNHVNFAVPPSSSKNDAKAIAFVSVGGEGKVLAFSTEGVRFGGPAAPRLLKEIEIPRGGSGEPHALWPSGDGTRLWIGLQTANAVVAVDASTLEPLEDSWVDLGAQSPMGMVYVPGVPAVVQKRTTVKAANASSVVGKFVPAKEALEQNAAFHFELVSSNPNNNKKVLTSLVVNPQSTSFVDALEAVVAGLTPGKKYALCLGENDSKIEHRCEFVVVEFVAGKDGAASVATVGPFRDLVFENKEHKKQKRFFSVVAKGEEGKLGSSPVQVQREKKN